MEAMFLLIGISLVVALAFLGGFFWAVRSKQYDDDFTPSVRMLFDDDIDNNSNHPDNSSN
ncbi:cbb3-type cytochrome oxidase assembly protein CcoS [Cryomorpha ignava]|uniref:Cbb3-type cytochrome oxidase assembly protein CcoS n=2 Tax=Cryomorpha ignava TaxID=101383 RepID=A0A7K3WS94_9FLAO|nr:cbb3-type cytochrome oxidase assembly protein CcoS [Cryomorpha ignava]